MRLRSLAGLPFKQLRLGGLDRNNLLGSLLAILRLRFLVGLSLKQLRLDGLNRNNLFGSLLAILRVRSLVGLPFKQLRLDGLNRNNLFGSLLAILRLRSFVGLRLKTLRLDELNCDNLFGSLLAVLRLRSFAGLLLKPLRLDGLNCDNLFGSLLTVLRLRFFAGLRLKTLRLDGLNRNAFFGSLPAILRLRSLAGLPLNTLRLRWLDGLDSDNLFGSLPAILRLWFFAGLRLKTLRLGGLDRNSLFRSLLAILGLLFLYHRFHARDGRHHFFDVDILRLSRLARWRSLPFSPSVLPLLGKHLRHGFKRDALFPRLKQPEVGDALQNTRFELGGFHARDGRRQIFDLDILRLSRWARWRSLLFSPSALPLLGKHLRHGFERDALFLRLKLPFKPIHDSSFQQDGSFRMFCVFSKPLSMVVVAPRHLRRGSNAGPGLGTMEITEKRRLRQSRKPTTLSLFSWRSW